MHIHSRRWRPQTPAAIAHAVFCGDSTRLSTCRGDQWAKDFAAVYGYDLATWSGFPVLLAMRDLVQLTGPLRRAGDRPEFAAALRQRLDGVRSSDTQAVWRAL